MLDSSPHPLPTPTPKPLFRFRNQHHFYFQLHLWAWERHANQKERKGGRETGNGEEERSIESKGKAGSARLQAESFMSVPLE